MTFSSYAKFYDIFYMDKEYDQEVEFLEEIFSRHSIFKVNSILDLGCGTGGHALPFIRKGYSVVGIDHSHEMLASARRKSDDMKLKAEFIHHDIRNFKMERSFDAVIAMFAVMSYQTANNDLKSVFQKVHEHLKPGGLWVFDAWFGPAVLNLKPSPRILERTENGKQIIRIAQPTHDPNRNVITVNYKILKIDAENVLEEIEEQHSMRYLFHPEIEFLSDCFGFEILHVSPSNKLNEMPDEDEWNVTWVLRAI